MNELAKNGGLPAVHKWTGPTGVKFRDVREPSGTYYRDKTPRLVIDALERAHQTGDRIRLFYGDKKTGRDWCEEYTVTGTVSRSTGPIHIPILIANRRSTGGAAILCDCIVRLIVGGREVYRHENYRCPTFTCGTPTAKGYAVGVYADGDLVANFKKKQQATRWIAFMQGERMAK